MVARTVIAFVSQPTPQYIAVNNLNFGSGPPLLPGMYQVPSRAQIFPNRRFNKNDVVPFNNIMTIYDYERSGKVQY